MVGLIPLLAAWGLLIGPLEPLQAQDFEAPPAPPQESRDDASLSLFDGQTLGKWRSTNFGGEGEVLVEEGALIIRAGSPLTGIHWTGDLPTKSGYEVSFEARKTQGIDFFCGLTFPVKESSCSLIIGGWAGSVVGLSNLDGKDASRNDTTRYMNFEKDRWYKIRLRVTDDCIQAWIDDEKVIDRDITDTQISVRNEVLLSRPLGICTFETEGQFKDLRWTNLSEPNR